MGTPPAPALAFHHSGRPSTDLSSRYSPGPGYGVHKDVSAHQFVSDGRKHADEGSLHGGVRHFTWHRAELLARDHPDDPASVSPVVLARKVLSQQQCGARIDLLMAVELVGAKVK